MMPVVEIVSTIGALLIGFVAFRLSKRRPPSSRDIVGVPMTYPDGKFSRKLSAGETLLFLALVFGFGGFCFWVLFTHYVEKG